jgi:YebC/PmpR family DNA-binding regulatory protein
MSGHSKWSTIKRKKGAEDVKRGKLFTRLAREITIVARSGGGDPNANAALRLAVDKARANNMPKENIERAIKRGTGELEGGELEEIYYEGYGPHGVALLVKCLTDNRNRTIADVRRVFNRSGGSMAEAGAVSWMFESRGYITVARDNRNPDDIFMMAVEAGAQDVETGDEFIEVYTAPGDLHWVRESLARQGLTIEDAELAMVAKTQLTLADKETLQAMSMIEALEELDDVQQVYSNLNISDSVLAMAA